MRALAKRRRDDLALVAAFGRAVYDGRELRGNIHRTDEGWIAQDSNGRLSGVHASALAAARAVLEAGRRA
jgi:hypothetical protein